MSVLSSSPPAVTVCVVYIDDVADRRSRFEEMFAADVPMLVTVDGTEALALLAAMETAIALVDVEVTGCVELLRTLQDRHRGVERIIVGSYADSERSLRMLADGLASRHVARPWQRAAVLRSLRARGAPQDHSLLQQRLAEADRIMRTAGALVHDLKSPLMTVLGSADHLRTLADEVASLRDALSCEPISGEQQSALDAILGDLLPMSEDLVCATEQLDALIETLRPLATPSHSAAGSTPPPLSTRLGPSPAVSLSPAAKRGT